jgi:cytochrome c2
MNKLYLIAFIVGISASQVIAGPLHNAARDGNLEKVQSLIASGEDVNKRDRNLGWPLHQAALNDFVEIAELLIAAGADVNVEHRIFGAPLNAAAQRGSVAVGVVLLANGAKTDTRVTDGSTPLHAAASGGHVAFVELLVAGGADVNARTTRPQAYYGDYRAVHSAGLSGHFDIVALLRSFGTASITVEPVASLLASADAAAGKEILVGTIEEWHCGMCHSIDAGDPVQKIGPHLQGVVGRAKASVGDYDYSEALKRLGGIWTTAELNAFIAAPLDYAPGTKMHHVGVADPAARANIIAFLLQMASE